MQFGEALSLGARDGDEPVGDLADHNVLDGLGVVVPGRLADGRVVAADGVSVALESRGGALDGGGVVGAFQGDVEPGVAVGVVGDIAKFGLEVLGDPIEHER